MKQGQLPALSRLINRLKLISLELFIVLITFIVAFITIVFVVKLIFLEKQQDFDMKVFQLLNPYINDSTTSVMKFFTFFGSQYFLIPANLALIGYTFFIKADRWFAIRVLSVALSSLILMFSLKSIFQRPRPQDPLLKAAEGLSFPSGHAFMSFAFFGLLIYMLNKKINNSWLKYLLMTCCFLFTVAIGLSRIYLRVHYASDVIAGFCLSLIWLVISLSIIAIIEKNRTKLSLDNKV